jgi:hypothetical protein
MTDITLTSRSSVRPYRTPWGAFNMAGAQTTSTGASSISIQIGRRLVLDIDGSTTWGRVRPSSGPNHFYLVGIAAGNISASTHVAGTPIDVWSANPMQEFTAATKGAVLASSHTGLRKKMMFDSTLNIEYIDLTASTATDWRVVITSLIDAEGDSGGRVSFRFLPTLAENNNSTIPSSTPLLAFFG